MAILIPQNPRTNATKREKKVFLIILKKIADDYLVCSNITLKRYYSNFVLIGKVFFVLEVKD